MAENFEGKGRSEIECPTWSMEVETVVVVRRFHRVSEGPVALEIDRRNHMDLLEARQSPMASEALSRGDVDRRGSTSEPMDICFGRLQATSEERDLDKSKI